MNEIRYQIRYALPIWLIGLATAWLPENRVSQRIRGRLMELILTTNGGLRVAARVVLVNVREISLGRGVYLGPGVWINGLGGVTIEDGAMLGPYVCIASTEHGFRDGSVSGGGTHVAPVSIGRGSWLGAHAVVAPGVAIGHGNVVAANAVVTKNSPANVRLAGVPAREIGVRTDNPSPRANRHG